MEDTVWMWPHRDDLIASNAEQVRACCVPRGPARTPRGDQRGVSRTDRASEPGPCDRRSAAGDFVAAADRSDDRHEPISGRRDSRRRSERSRARPRRHARREAGDGRCRHRSESDLWRVRWPRTRIRRRPVETEHRTRRRRRGAAAERSAVSRRLPRHPRCRRDCDDDQSRVRPR